LVSLVDVIKLLDGAREHGAGENIYWNTRETSKRMVKIVT